MTEATKPDKSYCAMPERMPAADAGLYQQVRHLHCEDRRPGHECRGRVIIDRNGVTLSCPRCGDARSVYPTAESRDV